MPLGRRQMLLGLATFGAAACSKKEPTPTAAAKPASARTYAGVEMLEVFPNGADDKAPLVVAIHGRGDRPEAWVDGFQQFRARAHVVLPRAFARWGDGYSWFKLDPGMSDDEIGASVAEAEAKLWPGIAEAAAGRKVVVTGFSQGGILSWVIAARHADAVKKALPISGACPTPLRPAAGTPAAPVLAFHGGADTLIPIRWDRASVDAFKATGHEAELKPYADVGHTLAPAMRTDWSAALAQAVMAA